MSLDKLKEDIDGKSFRKIYYICGEEDFLKRFYLGKIRESFSETDVFDGKECSTQEISDSLLSISFSGEKKLILITDLEPSSPAWTYLCDNPDDLNDENTVVIYNFSVKPDERKADFKKLKNVVTANGLYVDIGPLDSRTLAKWISQQCRKNGSAIGPDEISYIITQTDTNMDSLHGELQKICAYCYGRNITKADIDLLLTKSVDVKSYELTNAIFERNRKAAFTCLDSLYKTRTNEILILGTIYSSVSSMFRIKLLLEAGCPGRDICSLLDMKPFVFEKNSSALRNISTDALKKMVDACAAADLESKTTSADYKSVITGLLGELFEILCSK